MLESAEVGHQVGKAVFAREEPKLREALLTNQLVEAEDKRFCRVEILRTIVRALERALD